MIIARNVLVGVTFFVIDDLLFNSNIGGGNLLICDVTPGGVVISQTFNWTNGIFDVTWSESSAQVLVTGSGDGSLQVWHTPNTQVKYSYASSMQSKTENADRR